VKDVVERKYTLQSQRPMMGKYHVHAAAAEEDDDQKT